MAQNEFVFKTEEEQEEEEKRFSDLNNPQLSGNLDSTGFVFQNQEEPSDPSEFVFKSEEEQGNSEFVFEANEPSDDPNEFVFKSENEVEPVRRSSASEFAQRPSRIIDDGFNNAERTGSLAMNVLLEAEDMATGYMDLISAIADDPVETMSAMVENFVPAVIESYTRWGDAIDRGDFLEKLHDYPLQFVQDMTAPVSIFASGGASVAGLLGKTAKAAKVASAMKKIAVVADTLGVASDPIGGAVMVGGKKAVGLVANPILEGVFPEKFKAKHRGTMSNIDYSDNGLVDTPKAGNKITKMLEQADASVMDKLSPIHRAGRKTSAIRKGTDQFKKDIDNTLEQVTRLVAGETAVTRNVLENGWSFKRVLAGEAEDIVNDLGRRMSNKGLIEIMRDTGSANIDALDSYMVAKRVIELEGQGKITGADLGEARKTIAEATDDIKQSHKEWRENGDQRLDYMVKGGMISPEYAQKFKVENPNYVPMFRSEKVRVKLTPEQKLEYGVNDDFLEFNVKNDNISFTQESAKGIRSPKNILKKLKGSLRMVRSPIESDYIQTHKIMREVEINKVMLELKNIADVEGSGVKLIDTPKNVSTKVTYDEFLKDLNVDGTVDNLRVDGNPVVEVDSELFNPKNLPDDVVAYFENGQRKFLKIEDEGIASALATLRFTPESSYARSLTRNAMKTGRAVAKITRASVTSTPAFIAKNMIRDTVQASIFSRYNFVPVVDTMRGFYSWLKKDEWFDAYALSGGMNVHLTSMDRPALRKHMADYVSPSNADGLRAVLGNIKNPLQAMFELNKLRKNALKGFGENPLQLLQDIQELTEVGSRLGEFKKGAKKELGLTSWSSQGIKTRIKELTDQGVDVEALLRKPAISSRDITTDFAVSGGDPQMRSLNSVTAFLNANLRGIATAKGKFDPRIGATKETAGIWGKTAIGLGIPSMMMYYMIKDDEEYQSRPDVEKQMFWHMRPTPDSELWRIPKPHDIGFLGATLPVEIFKAFEADNPDGASKAVLDFAGQFLPNAVPTILKPIYETYTGDSLFFGTPLEPYDQRILDADKRRKSDTSQLALALSPYLKHAGLDISPIKIDNIVNSTTGLIGKTALAATNPIVSQIRGDNYTAPSPTGGDLQNNPLTSAFAVNTMKGFQPTSDFYDNLESYGQRLNTYKSLPRDEQRDYMREHKKEISLAKAYKKMAGKLSKLNRHKNTIKNDRRMSADEKRRRMNRIENAKRKMVLLMQEEDERFR